MEIRMRQALRGTAIAVSWLASACQAQSLVDVVSPRIGNEGAGLYEVSVFGGYSTSPYPLGAGAIIPTSISALGADENYGASAVLGWQHHRDRGGFSMNYSGSYTGLVRYSDASGYSQTFSLSADRKLSPKWSVRLSASGQDITLIQFLNEPSATSVISQIPTDFSDFAATFGVGNFSTAQAASTILGAPVSQTPLAALLLGNKVLSYSGSTGLSYAYSEHVRVHASAFTSGGQSRSDGQDGIPPTNYVTPFSLGANAGVSWSYSLSPRTQVGFNLDANTARNHFQSSDSESATASLGRKMGMHWFLRMNGGGTVTQVTQQLYGTPRERQIVGGGSLGVKTYTQSFVASYDRSASNTYGFAGTSTTLAGSWNRHHPGSRFSMFASVAQQQMRDTGFESLSGWQASAGISEKLAASTALRAQYSYIKSGGTYLGTASSVSVQSVRVSMNWSPRPVLR